MRNNKGQVLLLSLMIAITLVVLVLALAPVVVEHITEINNETTTTAGGNVIYGLNCTNADISNYDKATCLVTDLTIFHFIGGLIFIAIGLISARITFGV